MNVLITSASRKVALIKAFQRALSEEGGGQVIAVDLSPLSPALYIADKHFLVPALPEDNFFDTIRDLCIEERVDLIIPTRDEELPFFSKHAAEFSTINTKVMVPRPDIVEKCQNKDQFIQFCLENNFSVPKRYDADPLPDNIKFPLFVKPKRGKGGRHTLRISSRSELDLALKIIPNAIVQEYIEAPEYTIDYFADFLGKAISVVPRERVLVFGGESFVGKTTANPLLINAAVRLATQLGLIGHNTIQCFLQKNNVMFIEINPRFGGGASLGIKAGASTPHFLIKLLKGDQIEPQIGDFKDGYIMLRYTEDLFLDQDWLDKRKFL